MSVARCFTLGLLIGVPLTVAIIAGVGALDVPWWAPAAASMLFGLACFVGAGVALLRRRRRSLPSARS